MTICSDLSILLSSCSDVAYVLLLLFLAHCTIPNKHLIVSCLTLSPRCPSCFSILLTFRIPFVPHVAVSVGYAMNNANRPTLHQVFAGTSFDRGLGP